MDEAATRAAIEDSSEAIKTLAIGQGHVHPDDIAYALDVDRFDFAMRIDRVSGRLRLTRQG